MGQEELMTAKDYLNSRMSFFQSLDEGITNFQQYADASALL